MASQPELSPPRDLSHHFSRAAKSREVSSIKQFYRYFQIPGIGNLAGGLPNVSLFPFDTLEAQVAKPERWTPIPNDPNAGGRGRDSSQDVPDPSTASLHVTVPKVADDTVANPLQRIDLSTGLQYGTADGYPPLRSFVRQFTRNHLHPSVPYQGGPEIILTCGSTDGFSKAVEMIVEPWLPGRDPVEERPGMLCEVFVYMNAPSTVKPKGVQIVPVDIDEEGMLAYGPGGLKDVLENWHPRQGRRPHVLYTVPTGHNPTSGILPPQRRRDIYALCCQYDIIIVEDDPYWYLQYPAATAGEARSRDIRTPPPCGTNLSKPIKSSGYEFLDSLVPSYLSMDNEGRVIRLDTFSKTIAPGCRLGWVTAQPQFIERLLRITETSTQQPCGFVQSTVAAAIMGSQSEPAKAFLALPALDRRTFEGWHMDGWVRWLAGLRGVYERRMTAMCTALDQGAHQLKQSTPVSDTDTDWGVVTKTRLLSFSWPRGGMFVWVRVHLEEHPLWQSPGESLPRLDGPRLATALLVFLTRRPHLVIVAPGGMFSATEAIAAGRGWRYMRLCFAAEGGGEVEPCARRFANGVQRFWRIKSVAEMEKMIHEFDDGDLGAVSDDGLGNIGLGMGC